LAKKLKSFGLIGASRVGVSLAWNLKKNNFDPAYLWNRSEEGLEKAGQYVNFDKFTTEYENLPDVDLIIISVTDDAIESMAEKLARSRSDLSETLAFHNSGFHSSSILKRLASRGAKTGSLHPVVSIPDIEKGIELIPETVFTCEGKAGRELKDIADTIARKGIIINQEQKKYIHLSAVFVNNYYTALIAAIKKLMGSKGLAREDCSEIFRKLSQQAAATWDKPISQSLTGPLARGDIKTAKGHIKLLDNYPNLQELYRRFGSVTSDLYPKINDEILELFK